MVGPTTTATRTEAETITITLNTHIIRKAATDPEESGDSKGACLLAEATPTTKTPPGLNELPPLPLIHRRHRRTTRRCHRWIGTTRGRLRTTLRPETIWRTL